MMTPIDWTIFIAGQAALGAVVGASTNWIAIRLLFRPYTPKKFLGFTLPFTPSVFVRHQKKLADSVHRLLKRELINEDRIREHLNSERIRTLLSDTIKTYLRRFLDTDAPVVGDLFPDNIRDGILEHAPVIDAVVSRILEKIVSDDAARPAIEAGIRTILRRAANAADGNRTDSGGTVAGGVENAGESQAFLKWEPLVQKLIRRMLQPLEAGGRLPDSMRDSLDAVLPSLIADAVCNVAGSLSDASVIRDIAGDMLEAVGDKTLNDLLHTESDTSDTLAPIVGTLMGLMGWRDAARQLIADVADRFEHDARSLGELLPEAVHRRLKEESRKIVRPMTDSLIAELNRPDIKQALADDISAAIVDAIQNSSFSGALSIFGGANMIVSGLGKYITKGIDKLLLRADDLLSTDARQAEIAGVILQKLEERLEEPVSEFIRTWDDSLRVELEEKLADMLSNLMLGQPGTSDGAAAEKMPRGAVSVLIDPIMTTPIRELWARVSEQGSGRVANAVCEMVSTPLFQETARVGIRAGVSRWIQSGGVIELKPATLDAISGELARWVVTGLASAVRDSNENPAGESGTDAVAGDDDFIADFSRVVTDELKHAFARQDDETPLTAGMTARVMTLSAGKPGDWITDDIAEALTGVISQSLVDLLIRHSPEIIDAIDLSEQIRHGVANWPPAELENAVVAATGKHLRALTLLGGVIGAILTPIVTTLMWLYMR